MSMLNMKITNSEKHMSGVTAAESRYTPEQKSKLAKASKDFESIMTSMMLKSMTQSTGGLFGEEGYGGEMLDGLFENELSSMISGSNSLGIADMIYKKLTGEDLDGKKLKELLQDNKTAEKVGQVIKDDMPAIKTDSDGRAISPSNKSLDRLQKYENIIDNAAKEFGVDKNIIKSVILTESAGNERAVSTVKAKGLMQLMDGTARQMGVSNSFDPKQNIYGGTKYLSQMLRQYNGDLKLALAAYNAGPGNVNKYKGVPPFRETRNYITRVMGYLNHFNG